MANNHARLFLHYGDLADATSLRRVLELAEPDEIYNLGAQSHVNAQSRLGWRPQVSFEQLVQIMVDHDLELARQELTLRNAGQQLSPRGVAAR